jgi:putative spermidine/putrescine transport system substrate-binding protein
MKRRAFMLSVGGAAAGMVLLPRMAFAAPGVIDWYTSSDHQRPRLLDQHREAEVRGGQSGRYAQPRRRPATMLACRRSPSAPSPRCGTKTDPQVDIFEGFDARQPVGAREKGLYADVTGLSNYSKINPLAIQLDGLPENLPYRGSQVLLAYDTTKLEARRCAQDLGRAGRLDQGQSRPVHLQPSQQGRFGWQLRAPRHLRGQRQRHHQVQGRQLHRRIR